MIKMSLFLTRRADLTFEQFADHWLNVHWDAVRTVPEVRKYTIRYTQQHNIGGVPEGARAAPFDGIAEAWLDDLASVKAMLMSDQWASVVQEDDKRFLDTSKTLVMFTEEKVNYIR
ncbi:MAG: EthD domain-containing protein [Janthinobacterium lividum]